jgi:heptaprenylglyceryl phosphate synthase
VAARAALSGELIVAGSIDTPDRIQALAAAGADAFTIGTAAFEGAFAPGRAGLRAQIEYILSATP